MTLRFFRALHKKMFTPASIRRAIAATLLTALPATAIAQGLGLPVVNGVLGRVEGVTQDVLHNTADAARDLTQPLDRLALVRLDRLDRFVQMRRASVEMDDTGQPARAREVLLLDPDPAALQRVGDAGYALIEQGDIDGLGVRFARLRTPPGKRLASALRALRRIVPDHTVTADQIHFPGSSAAAPGPTPTQAPLPIPGTGAFEVGLIDGGVRPGPRIAAQIGLASGAPKADAHAQAIASLLVGAGATRIHVADVYGTDPAGGNALAIARALGWMQAHGVRVVSISLVGPANPLLARAVAVVEARGLIVVAAVGNDGAAAPPAYPASYPGVVAVTGVDAHDHVLFEAGRASHLDYAAPGADLTAIGLDGRARHVRGTSFAAPLAAARLAALRQNDDARATFARADREAAAPGPRTGRGVLCGTCRTGL
jgi:hypothetical protein